MKVIELKVVFMDGEVRRFEIPEGGCWFPHHRDMEQGLPGIDYLIIKPTGGGVPRFEVPLAGVRYYEVVNKDDKVEEVTTHEHPGKEDRPRVRRIPGRKLPVLRDAQRRITDPPTA